MSDAEESGQAGQGGFGKPPKAGQFRKGSSGNPHGRPRKKKAVPADPPAARHPTRAHMRAEADRPIRVKDASGLHAMSVRQALLRALFNNALKGGVLAQRTALERLDEEDERYNQEKKEIFEYCEDYQKRCLASIEAAIKAGKEPPDFSTHPDDVVLDWSTLGVTIYGATTEEERVLEKRLEIFQALGYEMMLYTEEDNCLPDGKGEAGRMGLYLQFYFTANCYLPPSRRLKPAALDVRIAETMELHGSEWGTDLKRRCQEAGFPFFKKPLSPVPLDKVLLNFSTKTSRVQEFVRLAEENLARHEIKEMRKKRRKDVKLQKKI